MKDGIEKGTLYYITDVNRIAVEEGFNTRGDLDLNKSFKATIADYGIRQPLVCCKNNDKDQPFMLRDGHRRLAVLTEVQEAGQDVRFPIILLDSHDVEVDPSVDLAISSMQRKALNAMEESDLCARLSGNGEVKLSNTAVGHLIGRSSAYVGQKLSFQKLSKKCQKALRVGKITSDYALDIVRQEGEDHDDQDKRLGKILGKLERKAEAEKAAKAATGKGAAAKAKRDKAQKDKKAAGRDAKKAAGGSSRPSKKELTGLASMYEVRFGQAVDDDGEKMYEGPVEILSTALHYAAGDVTEEDLFRSMAPFLGLVSDEGEYTAEWDEVRGEVEAEQQAQKDAEAAAKKAEKDAAKAKAKSSNGAPKPPKAPGKPKTKKKKSSKSKKRASA